MLDVEAGWKALSAAKWEEALRCFEGAGDDPAALEGVGLAAWWLDDADLTFSARERAYRLYRAQGDAVGAARVASALAWDALLFGDRAAVARGWLERASRLLRDVPLRDEHGWLAVREAEVALAGGELETALDAARRGIAIGRRLGLEDVQVVARSLEGAVLVHGGAVAEGMRRLDESAVAATTGEVADVMWIGKVCCTLIAACETVGDVERATQWCAEVKEFAQRNALQTLFNVCRTQYAAVLLEEGVWDEAEHELRAALEVFRPGRRAALVEGTARLGELRRRQGRLDEARELFLRSEQHAVARLGTVELALQEGDAARALALARRIERATVPARRMARIAVLQLVVRAAAAAGQPEQAGDAVRELDALADEAGTTTSRAGAARAAGVLAFAAGDLETARRRLEDAVDLFRAAHAPYERAAAQLELARVLGRLGLVELARSEALGARAEFERLSARHDLVAASSVLAELARASELAGLLTRREQEVLGLVARGLSNRQIAAELVVSTHTVHRHVANILRKLGEPTRAAAAARAARDGLV